MLGEYLLGVIVAPSLVSMSVYLHLRTRAPRTRVRAPAALDEPQTVNLTLSRDGVFR